MKLFKKRTLEIKIVDYKNMLIEKILLISRFYNILRKECICGKVWNQISPNFDEKIENCFSIIVTFRSHI